MPSHLHYYLVLITLVITSFFVGNRLDRQDRGIERNERRITQLEEALAEQLATFQMLNDALCDHLDTPC